MKSTVFSWHLKALWFVISWSDVRSEFYAAGPANARLRSTRDELQVVHSVDCSQNEVWNDTIPEVDVTIVQIDTKDCIRYE